MEKPSAFSIQPCPLKHTQLEFSKPLVMGIVNVTPDSFSDGGQYTNLDAVLKQSLQLIDDGADILDIGGESTRPGAEPVEAEEELRRVIPIIQALHEKDVTLPISIDTSKAQVAARALEAGASIINDVTALQDPEMADVAAHFESGLILMHMRGVPQTMQSGPIAYTDLIGEIRKHLQNATQKARDAGVAGNKIILDPGIGFGKEFAHNLEITNRLEEIRFDKRPILYGPSRKRFLGTITNKEVKDRDAATVAACVAAILHGADILRVHHVGAIQDALAVASALRQQPSLEV